MVTHTYVYIYIYHIHDTKFKIVSYHIPSGYVTIRHLSRSTMLFSVRSPSISMGQFATNSCGSSPVLLAAEPGAEPGSSGLKSLKTSPGSRVSPGTRFFKEQASQSWKIPIVSQFGLMSCIPSVKLTPSYNHTSHLKMKQI